MTLLDTGDFYGMGHNELLLRDALKGRNRDNAVISVKFGALRDAAGGWNGVDTRPTAIKNFLAYTLKRWAPTTSTSTARPASTRRADRGDRRRDRRPGQGRLRAAHRAVRGRRETLRRAAAVHPISDLQIEYSLISRGIEHEILPTARELGIGITAYGVLSRGLLSGPLVTRPRRPPATSAATCPASPATTWTATWPWSRRCARSPTDKGASVAQIAVAWALPRATTSCRWSGRAPGPGWRSRWRAAGRADRDDLAAIDSAVPAGRRRRRPL